MKILHDSAHCEYQRNVCGVTSSLDMWEKKIQMKCIYCLKAEARALPSLSSCDMHDETSFDKYC